MGHDILDLQKKRSQLKAKLGEIGDMRQGTLSERYRKCGKPNCRCAREQAYAHGPSFSLTRGVGGKTVTRIIPKAAVELTKGHLGQYQEFRRLNKEYVEVSELICEAKLSDSGGTEEPQKKTSKRISKLKLSEKSKS